eukprot:120060-Alexandrium_andersonii.AAC.1
MEARASMEELETTAGLRGEIPAEMAQATVEACGDCWALYNGVHVSAGIQEVVAHHLPEAAQIAATGELRARVQEAVDAWNHAADLAAEANREYALWEEA